METSGPVRDSSKVEAVLVFLMHQVIATGFIFFTATASIGSVADLPRIIGIGIHPSFIRSVSLPPYFPARTLWAFFLGWSLSGFLRHRTMLWVWVVPSLVLSWLFIEFPNCPVLLSRNACLDFPSAYSLFFGPNCTPGRSCLYQLYFTYPFLTAAAYSVGALLARRMGWLSRYAEAMGHINVLRACMLGAAFFGFEVALGWRYVVHRYPLPIWYIVMLWLFQFAIMFATSTYLFMVVIALVGEPVFGSRWFLNKPPVSPVSDSTAQPNSEV